VTMSSKLLPLPPLELANTIDWLSLGLANEDDEAEAEAEADGDEGRDPLAIVIGTALAALSRW
jgi:hypothetical protein